MNWFRSVSLASLLLFSPVQAATIVVLKAGDSSFARKYFSGFSSLATERVSAFRYDVGKDQALLTQIKKVAPDLIFTIGPVPVQRIADSLSSTPIIASRQGSDASLVRPNIVWLSEEHSVSRILNAAIALFPEKKMLGTIYNPKLSAAQFEELVKESGKLGFRLASLKVDSPSDVQNLIGALTGKADLLYHLHDPTTTASSEAILSFAQKNGLPLFTSDPGDVEKGALLSVTTEPFELGEVAWKIAKVILDQKKIPSASTLPSSNQGTVVTLSLSAANRLGISGDAFNAFLQKALKEAGSVQVVP